MRWVIERNLPRAEVDDDLTRQLVNLQTATSKLLKQLVAGNVGARIVIEKGSEFGLILDGWTSGLRYCLVVFAV